MNKNLSKILTTLLCVLCIVFLGYGALKAYNGNFLENSGFVSGTLCSVALVAVFVFLIWCLLKIWKNKGGFFSVLVISLVLASCNYAKSNQQVVVSDDCGITWRKINPGDAVPKGVGNRCFVKVVMPNYPMQGDSKFIANLKDRVRAYVHIDYDYSITDPLKFIMQAKYLGKANKDADDDGALNQEAFERAENTVIDKRIKEVSKSTLLEEDIVELDQAELENNLLLESNKILEPLGVQLNFITLTFELDEQTRQAIDIAVAMKIYESRGLEDLGKEVIISRAGATKITVETTEGSTK